MAATYVLNTKNFGNVDIYESLNCRRITLKVSKVDGRIRISCPRRTNPRDIVLFIDQNKDWIENARKTSVQQPENQRIFTEETPFETRFHRLHIVKSERKKVYVKVSPNSANKKGEILVEYPQNEDITTPEMQSVIKRCIAFALKVEAKDYLPPIVNKIAARMGVEYSELTFKSMISRWGSCSSKRQICLNVQLMLLPDELIEFVITHELCHILELNHGKHFHELLNHYSGGREAQLEKEMKKYSILLK